MFPTCHTFSILPFITLSQFSHLSHLPIVPICHTFSFFSFVTLPHPCVLPRVTPHLLPHVTLPPSMRFFPLATRVLPSSFYRSSSVSPPMRRPQRAARSTICSPVLSSPGRRPSPSLRCCFFSHSHPFSPYATPHSSLPICLTPSFLYITIFFLRTVFVFLSHPFCPYATLPFFPYVSEYRFYDFPLTPISPPIFHPPIFPMHQRIYIYILSLTPIFPICHTPFFPYITDFFSRGVFSLTAPILPMWQTPLSQ